MGEAYLNSSFPFELAITYPSFVKTCNVVTYELNQLKVAFAIVRALYH